MNVGEENNSGNENLKVTIPNTDYGRSKATGEREIFELFV